MPRPRIDMRKIREVLRLALGEELSRRQVAAASGVPLTTVNDYLRRAAAADLKWPLPGDLEDAGLEALLYPPAAPSVVTRPVPDWQRVHKELRRKGVTLQLLWVEYREAHPDGYGYSQFANLYRAWRGQVDVTMRQSHVAGEKLFVDFPGDTVPVWGRRTGEVAMRAELFVAVLGASNYLYAEGVRVPGAAVLGDRPRALFRGAGRLPGDRGLRQPSLGGDKAAPVRAGCQRHVRRDGRLVRSRGHPGAGL